MNIVVFGLTLSSSWGNGHATLWRGLGRALARRGHRLVFFERDRPFYAAHRDLAVWPDGELVLFGDWAEVAGRATRALAGADVGIVTSYCPDALAATNAILEARRPRAVFYDLDTPVTLAALARHGGVDYLSDRGLRDFDLVLSYTGGRALTELRERLGARQVAPLYGWVDPDLHRPVAPVDRFRADLSYLGTYAADRQAAVEALLLEPARQLPRHRFLVGGAQYPASFPWTANTFFVQHLEPAQHPAFFSSSRLTLNVTRGAMKAMGYCPSGRLFEAAACGTPLLTDAWEGLDAFFTPGRELLVANDPAEAVAAITSSDEFLRRVGEAGRQRTLDEHTATHRARELERLLATTPPTTAEPQLAGTNPIAEA